jgi:RNA polymerase sigma-70 factor (ECF subfamily)
MNLNPFFMKTPSHEEMIYDEYHKRLYYTALRILNNQFEAEEVMHDTLLKYFQKKETLSSVKEKSAWMTRVCVNLSIDKLRKRESELFRLMNQEVETKTEALPESQTDEEYSYKGVTAEMVKRALNKLANGYRLILSLNLFEGYDYEEIAQITNLQEVTVRSQYIRGKARLVMELEKMRFGEKLNK